MLLDAKDIEVGVHARGKKLLFQHLGGRLAARLGLPAAEIVGSLAERERLGSTGFGGGAAIPHGKLPGLTQVVGHFVRLAEPIAFDAVDGLPVDLVFALFSPPDRGADHLRSLAAVSRLLRDEPMRAKLRGARTPDAVYALIHDVDARATG